MKRLLSTVAAVFIIAVPAAEAHDKGSIQHKNKYLRSKVIKLHGKRAPGRDIIKYDLRNGNKPSHTKIRSYFNQLRRLAQPQQYLSIKAVPPTQRPAGTLTAKVAATGLASCVVSRESGGDTGATNGQYKGIAQWSDYVWARDGGLKYASDPRNATYQQQLEVLNAGLTNHGCADWCPYDGC